MAAFISGTGIKNIEQYQQRAKTASELQRAFEDYKPTLGSRILSAIRELVPHTDWGIYFTPEGKRVAVWKSWLGRKRVVFDSRMR